MGASEYREASSCYNHPLGVIDIHLQRCTKKVGVSCNGSGSCVESHKTCDDLCNYECEIRDNTYTTPCETDITGGMYQANIVSLPEIKGSKNKLCEGMPTASEIIIPMSDTKTCDWLDNPNLELQEHVGSAAPGTALSKFKKRHHLEGRRFTYHNGFDCTNFPSDFISRDYWIKSFLPSGDCEYSLKGEDALGFFNLKDSKYPLDIKGKTASKLPTVVPSNLLWQLKDVPADTQAVCYGGEAIKIENVSGEFFRVVERAACNSTLTSEEIKIGESVTVAGYLPERMTTADLMVKLLHQDGEGLPIKDQNCDCGPFTECLIDIVKFNEFAECYPLDYIPETIICKPTPIKQLMNEISFSFMTMPRINRDTGKIEPYKHKPPCGEIKSINLKQIDNCEISWKTSPLIPITTVTLKSHPVDCTKGIDDSNLSDENYKPNAGAFGDACTNPAWLPKSEKVLKTRFIGKSNRAHSTIAVQRLEYILKQDQQAFSFEIHASQMDFQSTDFRSIEHPELQNDDGTPSNQVWWINQIDDLPGACHRVHVESSGFDTREKWGIGMFCDDECPIQLCDTDECGGRDWNRVW